MYESPQWSRTTKTIVVVVALLLIALLAWRFQSLIAQIVVAGVIAYVLNPLIKLVDAKSPLSRRTVILVIYFVLLALVIGAVTALGFAAYRQVTSLIDQLPEFLSELLFLVRRLTDAPVISIGPFEFSLSNLDLGSIRQQLLNLSEPLLSRTGQYASLLAGTTVRVVGNLLFIWVVSIYLALEIPQLGSYVIRAASRPGFQGDVQRLLSEFSRIWSAYLRGQIVLGLVIGLAVGLSLGVLGVQNALALGLVSGLLEFVPVIGPVIGTGAAVIVAFFQPENYLGLQPLTLAAIVLGVMILIQQLENNILVPRIVGGALDLHPLMVIVGVFMGASLAGILGAILAAPILASLKLIGRYAWRKLFDLPPFPKDEELEEGQRADIPLLSDLRRLWQKKDSNITEVGEADSDSA